MASANYIDPPVPSFLFDLDGTLIDSVYQHVIAWRTALWSRRVRDATTDAPGQCSGAAPCRMRMTHDWANRCAMLMSPRQVRDLAIQVI